MQIVLSILLASRARCAYQLFFGQGSMWFFAASGKVADKAGFSDMGILDAIKGLPSKRKFTKKRDLLSRPARPVCCLERLFKEETLLSAGLFCLEIGSDVESEPRVQVLSCPLKFRVCVEFYRHDCFDRSHFAPFHP